MDFIKKLAEKKYTINYNTYLKLFLSKYDLIISTTPTEITFQADSVESLDGYIKNNFLKDNDVHKFIYDLGYQIMALKDDDMGILYFSLKDIIIINSNYFLFINPNKLFAMHGDDSDIKLSTAMTYNSKDNDFVPPELLESSDLSKTSWVRGQVGSYYSLAKIILFVFNLELENLYYTKLYFFLKRCLEHIPNKRVFLYL